MRVRLKRNRGSDNRKDTSEGRALHLAISETKPLGAGSWLRATAWLAVAVVAQKVFDPLTDTSIEVQVEGRVDGPSAGALLAVALLAAWHGVRVRRNVTMTGTILPNGSVGPVGGLSQKIRAAARQGFKSIIVPDCQHIEESDTRPGQIVDIEAVANEAGIGLVFVSDIDEAFCTLTRREHRAAVPRLDTIDEPVLTSETNASLRTTVLQLYEEANRAYKNLIKRVKSFGRAMDDNVSIILSNRNKEMARNGQKACSDMQEGNWVAAYCACVEVLALAKGIDAWRTQKFKADFALTCEPVLKKFYETLKVFWNKQSTALEARSPHVTEIGFMNGLVDADYIRMLGYPSFFLYEVRAFLERRGEQAFAEGRVCDELCEAEDENKEAGVDMFEYSAAHLTLYRQVCKARARVLNRFNAFYPKGIGTRQLPSKAVCDKWLEFCQLRNDIIINCMHEEEEEQEIPCPGAYYKVLAMKFAFAAEKQAMERKKDRRRSAYQRQEAEKTFRRTALEIAIGVELGACFVVEALTPMNDEDKMATDRYLLSGALRYMLEDARRRTRLAIRQAQAAGLQAFAPTWQYLLAKSNERGNPSEQVQALKDFWLAEALVRLQLALGMAGKQKN